MSLKSTSKTQISFQNDPIKQSEFSMEMFCMKETNVMNVHKKNRIPKNFRQILFFPETTCKLWAKKLGLSNLFEKV